MSECVSQYRLMQLISGDLSESDADRVKKHLASCPSCKSVFDEIEKNVAAFEKEQATHLQTLMKTIETSDVSAGSPSGRRRILFGAMAAAAAILLVLAVGISVDNKPAETTNISFKGGMGVEIVAKRRERQFAVSDGARLHENDALRVIVTTSSSGYLAVFSVDVEGKVWHYYPETDADADPPPMSVNSPGRHELPGSIILDDTLGEERFVVVFSKELFQRDQMIKDWILQSQTRETTDFGKDFVVESIAIIKEKRSSQ